MTVDVGNQHRLRVGVRPLVDELPDAVRELARAYPYSWAEPYCRYGYDVAADVTEIETEALVADPGSVLLTVDPSEPVAALGWEHMAEESAHFGVNVARAGSLLTAPSVDRRALGQDLFAELRKRSAADLVVAEVDTRDLDGLAAAVGAGFVPVDTSLTYIGDSDEGTANLHPSHGLTVDIGSPATVPVTEDEVALSVEVARASLHLDHWHSDPRVDSDRASEWYATWVQRAFEGTWADVIILARRDGVLVGFGCFKRWELLADRFAIPVMGRSLALAFGPEARGAGSAITHAASTAKPLGYRFLEARTSVRNLNLNNVVGRQGSMRLVRSAHVLHAWAG